MTVELTADRLRAAIAKDHEVFVQLVIPSNFISYVELHIIVTTYASAHELICFLILIRVTISCICIPFSLVLKKLAVRPQGEEQGSWGSTNVRGPCQENQPCELESIS